jgi:hypothetical protein
LARVTATEFLEWMAYERVTGPLDNSRGDVNAALVAKTIVDVNVGEEGHDLKLSDFLIKWGTKDEDAHPGFDPDNIDTTREVTESDGGIWASNPG